MNTIEQEKILLEGLANEDKTSIERIYREHFTMVQALVLNNSGSPDDAADIFQEAMIVLFEKARSGKFELQCQLKTYIYAVSRRLWLKRLPQLRRHSMQVENLEESISPEEDLAVHEKVQNDFNIMENALAQIGEPCKSLLEAYYIHRRHMHQIAADFGYTNADNAKTQKYKCLLRLKKIFFAQYKNAE
ncbi:MAG TPA: sigma-70 family RNA polymerase sigma factor [Ferruginibacter sp.]|nr:sigma-70 family RNA polymerase sigma factor [Ferruginibacter sp.]